MGKIKVGDRVRVEYTGVVQEINADRGSVIVLGRWPVHIDAVTVIEPEIPDNAIGLCGAGAAIVRRYGRWVHADHEDSVCEAGLVKILGRETP